MDDEIIYLEFNNWFEGRDYPPVTSISDLINHYKLTDDSYCKNNKLCVVASTVDMSVNWCITAPIEWVKKNFPEVLTDDEYEYKTILTDRDGTNEIVHKQKYNSFRRLPDDYGHVEGRFGSYFMDYRDYNFGLHWISDGDDEDNEE